MSFTIRPALALAAIATLTLAACETTPAGDPMGGIPANDYVLVGRLLWAQTSGAEVV